MGIFSEYMKNNNSEFYEKCMVELLKALDIQDVPLFMDRLTPENCQKLGKAYSDSVKQKLDEWERLIEVLRAARTYQNTIYGSWMGVQRAIEACDDINIEGEE